MILKIVLCIVGYYIGYVIAYIIASHEFKKDFGKEMEESDRHDMMTISAIWPVIVFLTVIAAPFYLLAELVDRVRKR